MTGSLKKQLIFGGLTAFLLFSFCTSFSQEKLRVTALKCNYMVNPRGVETKQPVLTWQITTNQRNANQRAYQILVADNLAELNKNRGNIWDSDKVVSEASIQIPFSGKQLKPAGEYFWKVRIWDDKENVSSWSKPAKWQMGLLSAGDWAGANWIAYQDMPSAETIIPAVHGNGKPEWGKRPDILPLLRREFNVKKQLKQATMFISGLGHFEMNINGMKVGDHFLDPGWTKYDKHALYVTFDVTKNLKPGNLNAIGVMLGNGFYYVPGERYRKITGAFGYPKMICRLVLKYEDGTVENIISDRSWKTAPGPVTFTSIYGGEDYNANLEQKNWDRPSFQDKNWKQALIVTGPPQLNSQTSEPVKIHENFSPVKITQVKPGIWVYDLGQNASAIPSLSVRGGSGATIKLTPGELLNEDGTVNQSASGSPAFYSYTLKGEGAEHWKPRFTYYGFRYIQVEGGVPKGEKNPQKLPVILDLKSLHVRNAARKVGNFSCSNNLFNRTDKLIDWAIKSNMVSVLTDCPHREKLGWLEEAHLMGTSIQYNYDIAALGRKLIRDMIVSQTEEGLIPDIAPEYVQFNAGFRDSPEWGSSGIILPWYMYQWYGDKQVLEESYSMMQRYADYLKSKSTGHIVSHGLGDWFDIGPKRPGAAQLTPTGVTATAIYYYDLTILYKTATLLGKFEDAKKYKLLAENVKAAFNKAYFNKETKQYSTGSQAANAMAIYMNLVEPQYKEAVVQNLVNEIRGRNNALTAGDIGYRYVLRVLEAEGRSDVIIAMNSRTDVPGYGWQLEHGATALTESWQAYGFVSNNHFMLGHLMEWFYSGLAGIRNANGAVGFKEIDIIPEPSRDVSSAQADFQSPYGRIASSWKRSGTNFELKVSIPANSMAHIHLPATAGSLITESGIKIGSVKDIQFTGRENGRMVYKVGSGNYLFRVAD